MNGAHYAPDGSLLHSLRINNTAFYLFCTRHQKALCTADCNFTYVRWGFTKLRRFKCREMASNSASVPLNFKFVITGHGWKNENEHVIRSHAMKHVRRRRKANRIVETASRIASAGELARETNCLQQAHQSLSRFERYIYSGSTCDWNIDRPSLEDNTLNENVQGNTLESQIALPFEPSGDHTSLRELELLSYVATLYSPLQKSISKDFVLWTAGGLDTHMIL
ncbi:hypothetical protein DH86_00004408 [Scytalidium sp. 3C]|nr:hypothetical protein DH86_00004408 [Scytalidium sp. 3C]